MFCARPNFAKPPCCGAPSRGIFWGPIGRLLTPRSSIRGHVPDRLLPVRSRLSYPRKSDTHALGAGGIRRVKRRRSRIRRSASRKGATAVEFAVVAPVVLLVVLALIQFASLLMSLNLLTAAARKGARLASLPTTMSTDAVVSEVREQLERGGIDPSIVTVNVTPTVLNDLMSGEELSVSVSGPMNEMVWIAPTIPSGLNLSAEIAYQRE